MFEELSKESKKDSEDNTEETTEIEDTKKCVTFPKRVNTKEFLLWIKRLYAVLSQLPKV